MAVIFSKTSQCALCRYWQGERALNPTKTGVRCAGNASGGVCANPKCSSLKGKVTKANYSSCGKFDKMPELR